MTDETENLVLELLRGMRADMAGIRDQIGKVRDETAAIRERLDAIETQMEGWRYVFVATTGSLVTDMKDHDTRIAVREGARV